MFRWFNSLRYRLMIFFGGISFIFSVSLVGYLYYETSNNMLATISSQLSSFGKSIEITIANNLYERQREITLLSQRDAISRDVVDVPLARHTINLLKNSYQYYSWIGFANLDGIVQSASDGLLEGYEVSNRPWFIYGLHGPFLGDVHEALLLAQVLKIDKNNPLRLIDFSAPVYDKSKHLIGVVAAHANWKWVEGVIQSILPATAKNDHIDVIITNGKGQTLYPFDSIDNKLPDWILKNDFSAVKKWPDGLDYLTSVTSVNASPAKNLDWKVVVRIPAAVALKEIDAIHWKIIWFSIISVLICLWFVYRMSCAVSLPIENLVSAVVSIQYGKEDVKFPKESNFKEISFLTDVIYKLTMSLLVHERSLLELNQSLERKVQERTKELEVVNEHLQRLARRDPLTDLRNRRAASEHLENEFIRYKRFGTPYAVIMLDIDHFKMVNDTYGHEAGDVVLVEVARLLKTTLRKSDIVA